MSLLLDALQRASQGKADLAPVTESPDASSQPLPGALSAASAPIAFPSLSDELSLVEPTASPAPVLPAAPAPISLPAAAPMLSGASAATTPTAAEPHELGLTLESAPPSVNTPPPLPKPIAAPVTARQPAPTPTTGKANAAAETSQVQVAKDIRQAHSRPNASHTDRRIWLLAGVAVSVALMLITMLTGLLGDPLVLLGLSTPSSITPPTIVANAPTAAVAENPVVAPPPVPAASQALPVTVPNAITSQPAKPQVNRPKPGIQSAKPPATTARQTAVAAEGAASVSVKASAAEILQRAYDALRDNRLTDAQHGYAQVLQANPDERDALLGLAYIAYRQGDPVRAAETYRQVLRQDPNNANAQAGLLALDTTTDATLSVSRARELLSSQTDSVAALSAAGNAFARDGQLAEAASTFARAQQLDPANGLVAYNLAVALDKLGQSTQALRQYQLVLAMGTRHPGQRTGWSMAAVRQRIDQLEAALHPDAGSEP